MRTLLDRWTASARRQVPRALFAVALAMQLGVPALHAGHNADLRLAAANAGSVLQAAHEAAPEGATHDAAGCLQCRLISQLGSAFPPSEFVAPLCDHGDGQVPETALRFASLLVLERGAPRGPPVLS